MAGSYRHQTLIEAPIEDVWAVISDPRTHPDWWPDVVDVRVEEPLVEGGEYIRSARLLPFLDAVEAVWVAERLEDLKEARFRCTVTGTWAHFSLTPAQAQTFVELETGDVPDEAALAADEGHERLLLQGVDPRRARRASQGGGRTPSCSPGIRPAIRGYVRPITSPPESADTVV